MMALFCQITTTGTSIICFKFTVVFNFKIFFYYNFKKIISIFQKK
jgi:hypothetical protein